MAREKKCKVCGGILEINQPYCIFCGAKQPTAKDSEAPVNSDTYEETEETIHTVPYAVEEVEAEVIHETGPPVAAVESESLVSTDIEETKETVQVSEDDVSEKEQLEQSLLKDDPDEDFLKEFIDDDDGVPEKEAVKEVTEEEAVTNLEAEDTGEEEKTKQLMRFPEDENQKKVEKAEPVESPINIEETDLAKEDDLERNIIEEDEFLDSKPKEDIKEKKSSKKLSFSLKSKTDKKSVQITENKKPIIKEKKKKAPVEELEVWNTNEDGYYTTIDANDVEELEKKNFRNAFSVVVIVFGMIAFIVIGNLI